MRYEIEVRANGSLFAVNRIGERGGVKNLAVYKDRDAADRLLITLNELARRHA